MPGTLGTAPDRLVVTPLDGAPDLLALSADPRLTRPAIVAVDGWRLLVADPVARLHSLDALDAYATAAGWRGERPTGTPFAGAAVGYLSDDLSPALLQLPPDDRPAVTPVPAVDFGVYDWSVAVDPDGRGHVVADREKTTDVRRWVATAATSAAESAAPRGGPQARLGMDRRAHADAVGRILEWIAAGDLYQANLTLQISVAYPQPPQVLAARLWAATPGAAHATMIVLDGTTAVVSASPETFLRTEGGWVTTRPIKGTRPRSGDAGRDQSLADALRGSTKDHAEHVMIVDLERNDLGRVCDPGTVRVVEYAALESHPTVWHLTSTVRGRLRDGVGVRELIAATFPPGSVTGTPKRMAVARTALLEPVRRGVYCGAIGVVGPGLLDLSVAIRTAVIAGGQASYGAGGGIVADSDPAEEFDEAMDKAAAFFTATGTAPRP
jgi:para-aminobenzoate synthetase component 1